jgi:type II restriction/modification system DNA methylase subunit YeeA
MSEIIKAGQQQTERHFFRASATDFQKIPGNPIAYWVSKQVLDLFEKAQSLGDIVKPRQGMSTNDNKRFLRYWTEINHNDIGFSLPSLSAAANSGLKWFPYNKGGAYRKWAGNSELVVNWKNDGEEIKHWLTNNPKDPKTSHWSRRIINTDFYFKESITWSDITTNSFAARYSPQGSIFDVKGSSAFPTEKYFNPVIGLMNSNVYHLFMKVLNPTVTFQVGDIARVPFIEIQSSTENLQYVIDNLISASSEDWESSECAWGFVRTPLLQPRHKESRLRIGYQNLRAHWHAITLKMQRLEEENNSIFIDAYGMQDELTPEVPLNEITLTCNPHYRYGGDKSEDELEALLLADTLRELVSYAVGCMFGRYALDKPGLILANQGEALSDYLKQVPEPSFPADDDNVIPMLDGDWFADDIAERFRQFLRVAFGEEHYEENLQFVEQSLNIKGKRNYSIRDYFLGEFYTDHVKRYKKRPIYWLFSSPKGSFNALIYMHRYRPDTVSVVLNDYLREFRTKLTAHRSHLEAVSISGSASQAEKTKALKEIESLRKIIDELDGYERDILYPLATEQVEIDLDDGVKVNYPKFGAALKKIAGLDAAED